MQKKGFPYPLGAMAPLKPNTGPPFTVDISFFQCCFLTNFNQICLSPTYCANFLAEFCMATLTHPAKSQQLFPSQKVMPELVIRLCDKSNIQLFY